MAFRIFTFVCVLAAARAGVIAREPQKTAPAQYAQYSAPAQVAQYPAQGKVSHYAALAPMVRYAVPAQVPHYAESSKFATSAQVARRAAPAKDAHHATHHEEEYAPAEYSFEYSVHDDHTGDIKSQKETRHGDEVKGYYSLIEADGRRRIVEYTADKHSGFVAVVRHEPSQHPAAQKPAGKIAGPLLTIAPGYSPKGNNKAAPAHKKAGSNSQGNTVSAPAYEGYHSQASPIRQSHSQAGSNHQGYAQAAPAKSHSY